MKARNLRWYLCVSSLLILVFLSPLAHAAIAVDASVSTDQNSARNTVSTPAFATASGDELLLAFVASDYISGVNTTVSGVSGGGLTWVRVVRTNTQGGTAEIWRAFASSPLASTTVTATLSQSVASSITVMSFTGVNTSGTNGSGAIGATSSASASSGAPTATLVTTQSNSWVFGVGNDYDNAISRVPGAGQRLVHQDLATVGDTYWVQMQNSPTALSGTSVSINDTAPTNDRYNLSAVEILAASGGAQTWSISGAVTPTNVGNGATLTLSGAGSGTATGDVSGNYNFGNLANGTYAVTPSKPGYVFTPTSRTITVAGANVTGVSFTATTWTISGTISPSVSGVGTLVTLSGSANAATTADATGFSFAGLGNGTYTVTPSKTGFTFSPSSQSVTINGATPPAISFTAQAVPTHSISGTLNPANLGSGTLLTLSGSPSAMTTSDMSGAYTFSGLVDGSYTVTPSKTGYTFTPPNQPVTISGNSVTGIDFSVRALPPPSLNYPDLRVIIPTSAISIAQTPSGKMLYYTHDTFNGGSGPLVIQPAYNAASGTYQGTQYIYRLNSGVWSIAQTTRIAGAFEFHAVHGHFHFPFARFGLYSVAADGGIGSPVVMSGKIGFCIADSFIYDPTLPNAGALGNLGSCSDPTSLRGLDIGGVDEYDRTDDGQSIVIDGVPDGTYWLRAVVDPDNYMVESDKSNNETDVQIAISGTSAQVLKTVTPVLADPPSISVVSPQEGSAASGTVQLAASTATTSGVQFLIDGQPLGSVVTSFPYVVAWDTTTVPNGTHWLAAQTTGPTGRIGTSSVVSVNVLNTTSNPPTVQLTSPANGSTVSAAIPLSATAASSVSIANVTFYVDNVAVGSPVTAPPYLTMWNSGSVADGQHTVAAWATDVNGNVGKSAAVTVTVDNSHPPKLIGTDAVVSVDGSGTMTTPAFATSVAGDFVVAFVSYDGPPTAQQTATVSGAGLQWTLLKRSNFQAGTSEIWAATATGLLSSATVISQPGTGSYHGSMTVIAFTNASGAGTLGQTSAITGAPDIFLPGVSAGSSVFAVGNDWDRAVSRVPVSGQVLVHQRVDTQVDDTFWLQSTAAPSTANGLVDIHDTSPTNDRWNYAAIEIVATRQ